jgi:ribA/ribD-fused uncharacterized protein
MRNSDFSGDNFFLSNFYFSNINIDNYNFNSVEQYFQWKKCINDIDREKIIKAKTPSEAKKIGRKVKIRNDWEYVKENVMYNGVKAKFTQNEELAKLLLATEDKELAEGNDWGDLFWGVDYFTREGQNKLGKILCKVRTELKTK